METERIQHLYRKHEKSILEVFETPFAGLMGLIHNQILMVNERMIKEIMDNVPPNERPPVGEDTTKFFESIQLPWRTEYTPRDVPGYVPR